MNSLTETATPPSASRPSAEWWAENAARLNLKRVGSQLQGPCPLCGGEDRFHVNADADALVGCRKCKLADWPEVIAAIGWKPKPNGSAHPKERRWAYTNVRGETREVIRVDTREGKAIRQEPAGLKGPWLPLGEVGEENVIVEGETCFDAVIAAGHNALTWMGGAINWRHTDWSALASKAVTLWPDYDEPGFKAMSALADYLRGEMGCDIRWVPPGGEATKDGWDAADAKAETIRTLIALAQIDPPKPPKAKGEDAEKEGDEPEFGILPPERSTYERLTNLKPLDPDVLPGLRLGDVAVLGGDPGTGKSFLALLWAAAVASGKTLHGVEPEVDAGPQKVLFITPEENDNTVLHRQVAMVQNIDGLELEDLALLAVGARGCLDPWHVVDQNNAPHAVNALRKATEEVGARLLILDPIAQARVTEDNETFHVFVAELARMAERLKCSVVLCHHNRKAAPSTNDVAGMGRLRGGSALSAAARLIVLLERDDAGIVYQTCEKATHGAPLEKCAWRFVDQEVEDCNGKSRTVGAIQPYSAVAQIERYMSVGLGALHKALSQPAEFRRESSRSTKGWFGFALADALGEDAGRGLTNKQRTQEQIECRKMMIELLNAWLAEGWVSIGKETVQYEKEKRAVDVISAGERLPEEDEPKDPDEVSF